MKLFLWIHSIMSFVFFCVVAVAGSVWTGFTSHYLKGLIPFLFFCHIEVLPFSLFAFLLVYFLKDKVSVSFKKKS